MQMREEPTPEKELGEGVKIADKALTVVYDSMLLKFKNKTGQVAFKFKFKDLDIDATFIPNSKDYTVLKEGLLVLLELKWVYTQHNFTSLLAIPALLTNDSLFFFQLEKMYPDLTKHGLADKAELYQLLEASIKELVMSIV